MEQGQQETSLFCYGCAHAAAGASFPGAPSGGRPCMFCIRNPLREVWQAKFEQLTGRRVETWYDGSRPVRIPMDCYCPLDMQDQIRLWVELAKSLEVAVAEAVQETQHTPPA